MEKVTTEKTYTHGGYIYVPGTYEVLPEGEKASEAAVKAFKMPLATALAVDKKSGKIEERASTRASALVASSDAPLPEDFPFYEELTLGGVRTVGDVTRLGEAGLVAIDGIAEKRAAQILAYVEKMNATKA